MANQKTNQQVLDLTDQNVLKRMGLQANQLTGPIGNLTLDQLRQSARNMGYTHFAFRDALRPGLLWVQNLTTLTKTPWQSFETARLLERLCPGLLRTWQESAKSPLDWEMIYPPMTTPSVQYAQVLEWLIVRYPAAVVAWVELALTYENDLKLPRAIESLMEQCRSQSPHWTIVSHVLGIPLEAGSEKQLEL